LETNDLISCSIYLSDSCQCCRQAIRTFWADLVWIEWVCCQCAALVETPFLKMKHTCIFSTRLS